MTKDELHRYIEESKGSESNICQICAYKDGHMVYSDIWHDYKKDDCVHIMSATKSVMALLIGITPMFVLFRIISYTSILIFSAYYCYIKYRIEV